MFKKVANPVILTVRKPLTLLVDLNPVPPVKRCNT